MLFTEEGRWSTGDAEGRREEWRWTLSGLRSLDAPLRANYQANGVNARDEMSVEDERRERTKGKPWHRDKLQRRERLVFANLMGKSWGIKRAAARPERNLKLDGGARGTCYETNTGEIRLVFMIRHVRLKIKSVISRLINDLVNYQRYLKML